MNKRFFAALLLLAGFAVPAVSQATVTSWDFASGVLQPLQSQWTANVKVPYITATSTTQNNTLPKLVFTTATGTSATTTNFFSTKGNFSELCVLGDCKTTWPSGASVAGSDTYVQFNDGGSFGGVSSFTFNKTLNRLSVTNASTTALASFGSTGQSFFDATGKLTLGANSVLGTPTSLTLTNATGLPIGGITGLGTGVGTALAVNTGSAGAFITFNGALGTPSSGTLTNATGLPIGGLTGLGTGVGTALAVNVGSAGAFLTFNGALGTPSSGTLTNATGYTVGNLAGLGSGIGTWLATPSSANLITALTDETGSGFSVFSASPTFTGTPLFSGFMSTASTTIGGGTTSTGLTVNGQATTTNLIVTASSTLANFTANNSTTTNATTTTEFATTASTTNLYLATGGCSGANALNVVSGKVTCGAVSSSGGVASFSTTTAQNLATTTIRSTELPAGNHLKVTFHSPDFVGNSSTTPMGAVYVTFNTSAGNFTDAYYSRALSNASIITSTPSSYGMARLTSGFVGGGFSNDGVRNVQTDFTFTVNNKSGQAKIAPFMFQRFSTTTTNLGGTYPMDSTWQGNFIWASSTPAITSIDIFTGGQVDQAAFATSTVITVEGY